MIKNLGETTSQELKGEKINQLKTWTLSISTVCQAWKENSALNKDQVLKPGGGGTLL